MERPSHIFITESVLFRAFNLQDNRSYTALRGASTHWNSPSNGKLAVFWQLPQKDVYRLVNAL